MLWCSGMGCLSIDIDSKAEAVCLGRATRTLLFCRYLEEHGRILYSRAMIVTRDEDKKMREDGVVENGQLKFVLGELRSKGKTMTIPMKLCGRSEDPFDFSESVC
jgi:hypothetical protein